MEKEMFREEVIGIFVNRALAEANEVDGVAVDKAQIAVTRELDEKIKDTFGIGVLEELRAFESGTGARQNILDALTARLSYLEAPATDAQTSSELPEPFIMSAQSILKPEQMAGFRNLAAEMPQAR